MKIQSTVTSLSLLLGRTDLWRDGDVVAADEDRESDGADGEDGDNNDSIRFIGNRSDQQEDHEDGESSGHAEVLFVHAIESNGEEDDDDNQSEDQFRFVLRQLFGRRVRLQLMDEFGSKRNQDDRRCQNQADKDDEDIFDEDERRRLGGQFVPKVQVGVGHEVVQTLLQIHDDDVCQSVVQVLGTDFR